MPTRPRRLATRGRNAFRLLGRAPRRRDLGHRAEAAGQRQLAAERREPQRRAHPARVGEQLEERAAHEPVAERARASRSRSSRASPRSACRTGRPRGRPSRRPCSRGSGRSARSTVGLSEIVPSRCASISWIRPRGRVHLLAPEQVGRAGRQAEAAVDAVARQRAEDVGRGRHASTPAGSKRSRTRSCRRRTGSGVASATAYGR